MIYSILAVFCLFSFEGYSESADLFAVQSLAVDGKVISVIPADLDDKGSLEIVVLSKTGVYPKEKRWITVYKTETSSPYSESARQRWEVDHAATMFDVGDIAPSPGREIFYLTDAGISYYPRGKDGKFSTVSHTLLAYPTITVTPDAGSLPRTHLLEDWKGNRRKMLLLPQFRALAFFDREPDGNWRKTDLVTIKPRTFLFSDNEDDGAFRDFSIHAGFRLPRMFVEDFNGDRRQDLVLTEQETLTVYRQQTDGRFSAEPSFTNVFPVRPPGKDADINLSVLTTPVDVNGDRFVDAILTVSKGTGKFLEQEISIFVFLNKQNSEFPFGPEPEQTITVAGVTPGVNIVDVNGDGRTDLLFSKIQLGFWKIVKNLISKRVNLDTSIYLLKSNQRYPQAPDLLLKTDYEIDLTHRINFRGTWPTLKSDFNGDGMRDLLIARDGRIEIFLNTPNEELFSKHFSQSEVVTSPFMHIADLNNDGLNDLLFYEKKRDGKISILLNTGDWEKRFPSRREYKSRNDK
ncbi:MAG: VCBS repeat-containing protein [Desulfobacterales bacterium]|nr:MAG: VCBS repeat-containing protein [Desulfobacterales bacterium]